MKILFTGASSFTGAWFARELAARGHKVLAVMRRQTKDYPDELRRTRVAAVARVCPLVYGTSFGDDRFLELIKSAQWDLFCHHGADATNYKDANFDIAAAVQNNTRRVGLVLDLLKSSGCSKIVLTGSVFENDEGAGSRTLEAFSPYGLSKAFTWQVFRYFAQSRQMSIGKFVIPNPFGPFEEPRFTHYLMKNWFANAVPTVNTPDYIRDNIHVSLLAKIYVDFVENLSDGTTRINPSGYVESQGSFTHRLAAEMRPRLGLKCDFTLKEQTDFSEPQVRTNTDVVDVAKLGWSEQAAWQDMADYYAKLMAH